MTITRQDMTITLFRSTLVAVLLVAASPSWAESLATSTSSAASSASSAGSASLRGSSDSIKGSSDSSRNDQQVAEGDYRVAAVAPVDGHAGLLRLTLEPHRTNRPVGRLHSRSAAAGAGRAASGSRRHRQRAPPAVWPGVRARRRPRRILPRARGRLAPRPADAGHQQLKSRIRQLLAAASLAAAAGCAGTGPAPGTAPGTSPAWAQVSAARFCDRPQVQDARQQDRILRFAAVVRQELEASGEEIALISRSGIDLREPRHPVLAQRLDHQGRRRCSLVGTAALLRLRRRPAATVRPGVAGFLFNGDEPAVGYVSIVLLPHEPALALRRAALDRQRALRLLAGRYSANAYPFSTRYQNCNQWVVEMMAAAWGELADGDDLRERAQAWLAASGYSPAPVDLDSHPLKFAATFMPLVHLDDHPADARYGLAFQVSLPTDIEIFVRQRMPQARRIELCHDESRVVIREGWRPIAEGCRPEDGDRVIPLG